MSEYVTVSFSGGKDSTAMLLHMMERGERIDEVLNVDTGMEFPAMYDHIRYVRQIVEDAGIKFTTLRNERSFEYIMLEQPIQSDKYGTHYGYGWPTPVIRWCTRHMKLDLLNRHLKDLRAKHEVTECIGLAADELTRLSRPANQQKGHRHPLVEWGWSEQDCLDYCLEREREAQDGPSSIRYSTACHAGAVPWHPSASSASYGRTSPSYGPGSRSGRIA